MTKWEKLQQREQKLKKRFDLFKKETDKMKKNLAARKDIKPDITIKQLYKDLETAHNIENDEDREQAVSEIKADVENFENELNEKQMPISLESKKEIAFLKIKIAVGSHNDIKKLKRHINKRYKRD